MSKQTRQEFYADIGFRLRQIRSLNRVSQEALGDRLGVSKQTIQRYESGEIQLPSDVIAACAVIFGTPVGEFYGEAADTGEKSAQNRAGLMVAAEIMALPNLELRKSVFHMVRQINRTCEERERSEGIDEVA